MLKDAYEIPIKVGDTVLLSDGCICFIRDFITGELVTEALLEDKLTHNFRMEQLKDLMKIQ